MADKTLSNYAGATLAGIVDDLGNPLVSPSTSGGSAFVLGPSVYRLIVAGVSNGDIAMPPADATALISDDNPLPFFTWDNSGGTGITAQILANGTSSSGNALRITIGTAVTSGTATLSRIEPITGTGDRGFAFIPQMTAIGTLSGGTAALADLFFSWLAPDQSTVVGTAPAAQTFNFQEFYSQSAVTLSAGDDAFQAASLYNCAPVGAAFLQMTARFRVTAAGTGVIARTLDITDFAIAVGEPIVYLAEHTDVNRYGAGFIQQDQGSVTIESGRGTALGSNIGAVRIGNGDAQFGDPTFGFIQLDAGPSGIINLAADSVEADNDITAAGSITATGDVTGSLVVGSRVRATTTAEVTLASTTHGLQVGPNAGANLRMDGNEIMAANNGAAADLFLQDQGGDVYIGDAAASAGDLILGTSSTSTTGALIFKNGNGGSIRPFSATSGNTSLGVYNSTGSSTTALVASGFYPAQGSSYLGWSGFNFTMNDTLDVTGVVIAQNFTGDLVTTTTQTSSAAIWVLTAGTTYNLRRNSSSLRYKTNVTDADDNVLESARRVRPRHYESTIADEAGATRLGFIAEEVHDAGLTHAVGYDEEGRPESLDATALIAALWHRVDDLEARLAALEAKA